MEVTFQSGEVKKYDMAMLFEKYPQLEALNNRDLFLKGSLISAYGIIWNEDIDIEVETIYEEGVTIDILPVNVNYIVADAVSNARSKAGISQKELSRISGIDQSDISKIERGVSNPSIMTLDRVAKALGMNLQIAIK